MPNILEKILYLNPNAKCCVWLDATQPYGGENDPIPLDEGLVDWNQSNASPCPTQAQLNAVPAATAIAQYLANQQALQTVALMQNPVIASNYQAAVAAKPSLTPAAYISQVQAVSTSVTVGTVNTPQTSLQTSA